MKKRAYGILLIFAAVTILLLTFQNPAETVKLSETFRLWFEKIGIHSDFHSFRSNAHLVVYFVLGVALSLYGKEARWKWRKVLLLGMCYGLLDEGIKILLPTREFDWNDLLKDWVGVAIALLLVWLPNIKRSHHKRRN